MRRQARKGGGKQIEVTVETLGGRGDGVAHRDGQPVFVPFTLPGETVRVRLKGESRAGVRAEALEILDESPERVEPPCPHFGPCGGCSVQHLGDAAYRRWTLDQVTAALERRGFVAPPVRDALFVGRNTRRRAVLAAQPRGKGVALGFHGRESHRVEDISTCHVLTPGVMALLPDLRKALWSVLEPKETADVTILESNSGADVLIASRKSPGLQARQTLAAFAERQDVARLSWRPAGSAGDGLPAEPVAVRRPPLLYFGTIPVEPPEGGFVQPTAAGEDALVETVTGWLSDNTGPVADLYAGVGTFTFPLARQARVHAVEGSEAAMASLWQAARKNDMMGRVTAEVRDLAEDPLGVADLAPFGAVVFDPPRAGAKAQAEALAESDVGTVVAVSCNPNTFGRDARALVDGGFELKEVRPIDQFPWTGHVELAALFSRV